MAFSRKVIAVTFQLGEGRLFPDTGTNTRTTVGLKVHVSVTMAGGAAKDNSEIVIYGLSQSAMNELSTYGAPVGTTANNTVILAAGDEGQPLGPVFKGTIQDAVIDYNSSPEVAFVIRGFSMLFEAVAPAPPVSIAAGGQKVSVVMAQLASQLGLRIENSGVEGVLAGGYHYGSAYDQVQEIADAGNFNAYADMINGVLAIWPIDGQRTSQVFAVPQLISAQTGLVGYPSVSNRQLDFRVEFNPGLRCGAAVKVKSIVLPACGMWVVQQMTHTLESETANGAWFSDVHCLTSNQASGASS